MRNKQEKADRSISQVDESADWVPTSSEKVNDLTVNDPTVNNLTVAMG